MEFEEKSAWVQLVALILIMGAYLAISGTMLLSGITVILAYVPLFVGAVTVLVVVLIAGHILAASRGRVEDADERGRLIQWKAESKSSWVLGLGVLVAITGLVASAGNAWIAHLLLLSLVLSEVTKLVLQLVYYRRGV